MLVEERRQRILSLVNDRGFVPLAEFAIQIGVSESTIRRDLDFLDEAGALRKTHGGAISLGNHQVLPAFEERTTRQHAEKVAIGRQMASLIRDGETVFLDGGTTTLEVARQLLARPVQVVTNSLPVAVLLNAAREVEVILIGGYVYPKTGVAIGPIASKTISEIHVDQLVLSVGGVGPAGLYNTNSLLVDTQKEMIRSAKFVNVVADHSKFGKLALILIAGWDEIHRVVVDEGISKNQRHMIGKQTELAIAPT